MSRYPHAFDGVAVDTGPMVSEIHIDNGLYAVMAWLLVVALGGCWLVWAAVVASVDHLLFAGLLAPSTSQDRVFAVLLAVPTVLGLVAILAAAVRLSLGAPHIAYALMLFALTIFGLAAVLVGAEVAVIVYA